MNKNPDKTPQPLPEKELERTESKGTPEMGGLFAALELLDHIQEKLEETGSFDQARFEDLIGQWLSEMINIMTRRGVTSLPLASAFIATFMTYLDEFQTEFEGYPSEGDCLSAIRLAQTISREKLRHLLTFTTE